MCNTKYFSLKDILITLLEKSFAFNFYVIAYFLTKIIQAHFPELQKSDGYAGITREEGLQNGQSARKVSCHHTP